MITRRTLPALGACLVGLGAAGRAARAQEAFPTRPITLVVAWAPGGSSDLVGRMVAEGTVADIVRKAEAPRKGRIRVPSELVREAAAACARAPGVESAEADGQPGWVTVTLASNGQSRDALMNEGLRAVIDESVPVLSFELEGARLSDAFLAMTEDAT